MEESPAPVSKVDLTKLELSVTLWLMLLVFGGGLLFMYYAGINYFPEVSWQDALTYIALMAMIGGSLLLAYSFLLFVPGAIWSEILVFDPQLSTALTMRGRESEPCVKSISQKILFPFAVFMTAAHFLFYLVEPAGFPGSAAGLGAGLSLLAVTCWLLTELQSGLAPVADDGSPKGKSWARRFRDARYLATATHVPLLVLFGLKALGALRYTAPFWIAALGIAALSPLVTAIVLGARIRTELHRAGRSPIPDEVSLLSRAAVAFGCGSLLSLAALWFFYRIYGGQPAEPSEHGDNGVLLLLLLCTFVVIVTNLAVAVFFRKHRWTALATSLLAAMLLLVAGQLLPRAENGLAARVMDEFGFGGRRARLVVTERGGRILCQQGVEVVFDRRLAKSEGNGAARQDRGSTAAGGADDEPNDTRLARTSGLSVLSRLGSEYVLRAGTTIITLPKGEVVSWSPCRKCAAAAAATEQACVPTPRQ